MIKFLTIVNPFLKYFTMFLLGFLTATILLGFRFFG